MTFKEYQEKAARTINSKLTKEQMLQHSLYGMASEIGEILGIHQKKLQGKPLDEAHQKKETGDAFWMLAEYCTANGWDMDDVAQMNIDKLLARYPDGFDPERSEHRAEGDV